MEYKYDVFISYSRKDTAVADKICDAMDRNGISYFIDRQGIGGGNEFPEILAEAIEESRLFLFIASQNAYQSKYTKREITYAFNEKAENTMLPYVIDGSEMPRGIKLVFASTNRRDMREHPIEPVLVNDLLRLLGREVKRPENRTTVVSQPLKPKPQPTTKPAQQTTKTVIVHKESFWTKDVKKWAIGGALALVLLGVIVIIANTTSETKEIEEVTEIAEEVVPTSDDDAEVDLELAAAVVEEVVHTSDDDADCSAEVAVAETVEHVTAIPAGYVDLGLPSGTLWKDKNEPCGLCTYDESIRCYGDNMPSKIQFEELIKKCHWKYTESGYLVIGPNGNSIVFTIDGYRFCDGEVDELCYYWSGTEGRDGAWCLGVIYEGPSLHDYARCSGLSIRLVKKK